MTTQEYTVRFRQHWMHYDQTYGIYETEEQAKRAARKASKDERVSTVSVESGRGLEHRTHGTWMNGRKVS